MQEAQILTPCLTRLGCFTLTPNVKLRCITDELMDDGIKKGEIVTANSIDESGKYQDCVHLTEHGYWWPVEYFELVK